MLSTPNGCMCHAHPSNSGFVCKSCESRKAATYKCRHCRVGIWTAEGDYEGFKGLCSNCYEMIGNYY